MSHSMNRRVFLRNAATAGFGLAWRASGLLAAPRVATGLPYTAAEIAGRLGISMAVFQRERLGARHVAAIRELGIQRIELVMKPETFDFQNQRQNAYMNFTVWGYNRFYWFDEFDSKYLHLGRARDESRRVEGTGGHVYVREFDDGWAVMNPTSSDVREILVPGGGTARILGHDTFRQADPQSLVEQFELRSHRGVILLKPGRKAGNEDNEVWCSLERHHP
jgi:hypothetical protein